MERPPSSVFLAEVYGTFLLVFVGTTAITVSSDPTLFSAGPTLGLGFVGLAFGLALIGGIASVGSVSGAVFNPAITIALFASGRIPRRKLPTYIGAQFLGATLAAAVEFLVVGMAASSNAGVDLGSNVPNFALSTPIFSAVLAEIVGTMFLTMAVLGSTDSESSSIAWGTSGIGFVLAATIWALGAVSGASLNPARSFGPALISLFFDTTPMIYYWIYLAGPVLGALLAAVLYRLIYKRV